MEVHTKVSDTEMRSPVFPDNEMLGIRVLAQNGEVDESELSPAEAPIPARSPKARSASIPQ